MAKGEFDEIREKLCDHQEPVDAGLWPDIQEGLRKRRIRKLFCRALSSAAAIAAIFLAITSVDIQKVRELEYFAQMISSMPVQTAVVESNVQREILPLLQDCREEMADTDEDILVPSRTAGPLVQGSYETAMTVLDDRSAAEEMPADAYAVVADDTVAACAVADGVSDGKALLQQENAPAGKDCYDDWAELLPDEKEKGKRYAMAFNGGLMPGSSANVDGSRIMAVSSADGVHHGYMVEQVSDTEYSLPLNLGVQLQFPVGEKLSLGVGVSYTMLRSKFDCLVNKVRYNGQQTLHYIGIPVNVYGVVAQRDKFIFYINGGAMIEKGLRAKYKFSSYKDSHSHSTGIDGLQFSVNAGLGVEYRFADYMGLYFEPNIIYFTNSDVQYSIRTDQPFQVKADIGFRFHF